MNYHLFLSFFSKEKTNEEMEQNLKDAILLGATGILLMIICYFAYNAFLKKNFNYLIPLFLFCVGEGFALGTMSCVSACNQKVDTKKYCAASDELCRADLQVLIDEYAENDRKNYTYF